MIRKISLSMLLIIGLTCLISNAFSAQGSGYFSLHLGPSMRVGDTGANWRTGSNISSAWTHQMNQTMFYGVNFGYSRWTPCCEEVTAAYDSDAKRWDTQGHYNILEFSPYIRIAPNFAKFGKTSGYFQAGGGLYLVESNWSVVNEYGLEHNYFGDHYNSSRIGFSVGGGFIFGDRSRTHYEVSPKYNIVFDGNDTVSFIGLTLGLAGPEGR